MCHIRTLLLQLGNLLADDREASGGEMLSKTEHLLNRIARNKLSIPRPYYGCDRSQRYYFLHHRSTSGSTYKSMYNTCPSRWSALRLVISAFRGTSGSLSYIFQKYFLLQRSKMKKGCLLNAENYKHFLRLSTLSSSTANPTTL